MTITRGTVIAGLLAVAGTAVSVQAQTFQIEARIVVDGQVDAPVGAGIDTFLPGPQATRVGLTVQARVKMTASATLSGVGNYGIGGINNASASNLVRFTHNDTVFSGGTYQPFGRGRVSAGNDDAAANYGNGAVGTAGTFGDTESSPGANDWGPNGFAPWGISSDNLPLAGAFGRDANAVNVMPGIAKRDFRIGAIEHLAGVGNTASANSPQGNDPQATGGNADSANGFFPLTGAQMSFVSAVVGSQRDVVQNNLGTTPVALINVFSPYYNIYRIYFDPKPNSSDPTRNVTVSLFARFLAVTRFSGGSYTVGNPAGTNGGLLETTVTATFQVPTPGAAALLGLGGLMAARRRRA